MKYPLKLLGNSKFLNHILHSIPYSVILFVLILFLLPPITEKYIIKLVETGDLNFREKYVFFEDLNNDGNSEIITVGENLVGNLYIIVTKKNDNIINQWNLKGSAVTPINNVIFTGNKNSTEPKHIYISTLFHDSIFLHAIDPLGTGKIVFQNLFINTVAERDGKYDAWVDFHKWYDFLDLGYNQALISLNAGYSRYPRQLLLFDPVRLTLKSSPIDGAPKKNIDFYFPNDNSKPYIISKTHPYSNYPDTSSEIFHDRHSWLLVFDSELNYKVEPIPFPNYPGRLNHYYFNNNDLNDNLGSFHFYDDAQGGWQIEFFQIDSTFNTRNLEIVSKNFNNNIISWGFWLEKANWDEKDYLFFSSNSGLIIPIEKTNKLVGIKNPVEIPKGFFRLIATTNNNTLLSVYSNDNELWISKPDLKGSGKLKLDGKYNVLNGIFRSAGIFSNNFTSFPAIQIGRSWVVVKFSNNPIYSIRFFLYFIIFLSIVGFISVVRYTQKLQIERKLRIENEMASLQLKSIKNQIDPHFMLNVLNNISSVFITGQKDIAMQYYKRFTYLIKQVLTKSNDLRVTLSDEFEFIENYLEIEKLRLDSKFSFNVDTEPNVNKDILVPRMLIFTFVENAIKHGLFHSKLDKVLNIYVSEDEQAINVIIEDNGIGRKNASLIGTKGTEKGLSIVNQIIDFHKKLYGQTITFEIDDLTSNESENSGTIVKLY